MARQKGKSTRSAPESSVHPTKRRRKQQRTAGNIDDATMTSPTLDSTVLIQQDMETNTGTNALEEDLPEDQGDDSDDESIDWETVELPKWTPPMEQDQPMEQENDNLDSQPHYKDVQVVFETPRAVLKKSKWEMAYQRQLRDWIHNSHVVLLVAHFMIRNAWSSRDDVQSVCLSVIPDHIISQSKRKGESDTQFGTTIKWLLTWWHDYFKVTGLGMRTRPLETFNSIPTLNPQDDLIEALSSHMDRLDIQDSEIIEDPSAFVNYLANKSGCRDLSSQLFTSILRTLGFETRLICSLQPVPFRIPASKTDTVSTDKKDNNMTAQGESRSSKKPSSTKTPDHNQFQSSKSKSPTIWCEVWNPHQQQWICIDPIRQLYNKPHLMEPNQSDRQNILSFVLAFEQQQQQQQQAHRKRQRIKCVVDVTRRYSSHLQKALSLRERELTKRERQGGWRLWSDLFLNGLLPKYDDTFMARYNKEQEQLEEQQNDQRMPTSIQGLRNHPLYVLERHLKKFEVLHHPTQDYNNLVIGQIRGEKIYPRSCVQQIHTRESWMKQGRVVLDGEQPVKCVLARAVTLEKKRLQEEAKMHGDTLQSDCFGYWQTAPYKPPPVINGKITKNAYGRLDLFTPDMIPDGAVHMENDGLGKIARQLGIDYAEAVVDFEFIRGRSIPTVNGIVVAKENEFLLLEAWREYEQHKTNKVLAKQEKEVYGRWRKLILGAMIDARVDNDYGNSENNGSHHHDNSTAWDRFMKERNQDGNNDGGGGFVPEDDDDDHTGGFLPEDDDV
ncbi:hypothetical protein BC941DRAFT_439948 [Chlamydoabsidia padenii]|nr:hypothetical protein BC941DRAFT_439948 [Chlamydoabsidia padenii]